MESRLSIWSALLICTLVLGAVSLRAAAAEGSVTGTWKWSATGRNGQTIESTLQLKQDGEKLSGSISGRAGRETPITDGSIKDSQVSFTVSRERNGQTFMAKYQGKLTGDTIKGTIETERNGQTRSRDWEAKRAGAAAAAINPTGTWKWSFTPPNGGQTFESTLKLKMVDDKLTGTLSGRRGERTIEEAKLNGNDISFSVTRERNGQKFTSKYVGKIEGDTIKGKVEMTFGGEPRTVDWEAKREKAPNATGTWKWAMTMPNGNTMERSVKLKQDGSKLTGVSTFGQNETPIEEGKVQGDEVSFQINRERNGQKFTIKYHGKIAGDSLKGKIEGNFGGQDRSIDWDAKRAE